jgi:hypothetical protein
MEMSEWAWDFHLGVEELGMIPREPSKACSLFEIRGNEISFPL